MIPDLQSCLLCDDIRCERNGKIMLIGIFEGLALSAEHPICPQLCIFSRWCEGEGKFVQKTKIFAPDGTTVVVEGKDSQVMLPSERHVANIVEVFRNVRFAQNGTHWVEVTLDQDLKIRFPLFVRLIEEKTEPEWKFVQ